MATGLVLSARVVFRRFISGLIRKRSHRIRLVGLMIAACTVATTAMVSVPTVASAQTAAPSVTVTSPLAGSCATTSTRNLQASFSGTGTVVHVVLLERRMGETGKRGDRAMELDWCHGHGTYSMVAKQP